RKKKEERRKKKEERRKKKEERRKKKEERRKKKEERRKKKEEEGSGKKKESIDILVKKDSAVHLSLSLDRRMLVDSKNPESGSHVFSGDAMMIRSILQAPTKKRVTAYCWE